MWYYSIAAIGKGFKPVKNSKNKECMVCHCFLIMGLNFKV